MSNSQEDLFNEWMMLKYKIQNLAGVIQNPIEEGGIGFDTLMDWNSNVDDFLNQFNELVQKTNEIIASNISSLHIS